MLIKPTAQPAYCIIKSLNMDWITRVGDATGVNNALAVITGEGEGAFLTAANGQAAGFKPLPSAGWLEAGQIYGYNNSAVIVRQSHFRTIYPPEQTPALFLVYRAGSGVLDWVAGEQVEKGTHRMYGGKEYVCIQAHVTQADWTPDKTPTLWSLVPQTNAWAYPVAYKVGDIVTYQGVTYRCLQAHTSQAGWTPPAVPALWQKQ